MRGLIICCVCLVPTIAYPQQPGAAPLPAEARQFLELQIGTWEVTPTDAAAKWKAKAIYNWMPGKYCLAWAFKVDGVLPSGDPIVGSQAGVVGWDQAKRRIVVHNFDSWGGTATTTYRLTPQGMEGEQVTVMADGTNRVTKITWTLQGRDEYLWKSTAQDGSVFEARNVRTGK